MEDFAIETGKRLRNIREILNEGGKLSAEQFAFIINESRDKIINFELGRTAIPIKLLFEIYKRGFDPNYIISGSGSLFLDDDHGKRLRAIIEDKLQNSILTTSERAKLTAALAGGNEYSNICEVINSYKVAAGRIKK